MHTLVLIIVILLILLGVAGTVFPLLPGVPFIFIAIAGYGWYEGFQNINAQYLAILAGLAILSLLMHYLSTTLGARYFGSSRPGTWGALLGTVAGIFIMPPIGLLLCPWIGAVVGESLAGNDLNRAFKVGVGTVVGLFTGMVFNLVLAIIMLISFLIKVF